ncbi:hypothetical protein FRB97_006910 [Tulasnella sp. 331]|nr:hypothetical protein FRB97_006910 [Tulasnella sp. 331]
MSSYATPGDFSGTAAPAQPKPISTAYDLRYISRPSTLLDASSPNRVHNDSSGRRNHHAEEYRNDGRVRHQQQGSMTLTSSSTTANNSFESTSPYGSSAATASIAYISSTSPFAQHSAPRFPLSFQPPQPTCELSQWITTTTTNSPVQQLQPLNSNQQPQQSHQYSSPTHQHMQYQGQPGSMSSISTATSSSFPSTTSPASDAFDYGSSSPDMYNSPSYQHLSYPTSAIAPSSLPVSSALADIAGGGWPSSAPAASGTELCSQMHMMLNLPHTHHPSSSYHQQQSNTTIAPMESANFYSGFAGLGLQSQASSQLHHHDDNTGVSPRDVMASTTVVDADDFGTSWGSGGSPMGDYPVVGRSGEGVGFSPDYGQYPFSGGDDLDLSNSFGGRGMNASSSVGSGGGQIIYQDPFHSSSSPSEHTQSQQTQFPLELENDMEASMATVRALPVSKSSGGGRLGLQLLDTQSHLRDDTVMPSRNVVGGGMWDGPASAPVDSTMHQHFGRRLMKQDRRPSLHTAFIGGVKSESPILGSTTSLPSGGDEMMEQDEEEDEEEDEDEDDGADDDDDYVEERGQLSHHQHHSNSAGPNHRGSARRHSHNIPRPTKLSKRSSPYSRPRPSATNSSNSTASASGTKKGGASGEKKVKAVKWESTKPKYWIPEGFDPWWDQKSRGRGVETISSSANDYEDDGAVVMGERDTLPHDWRELVRGMGNPARPFVCPAVNCGKTFQRSEHAKRHAGSLHTPDAVKVSCLFPNCDHKSTRGDNLKQHMDSHRRKKGGGGVGSFGGSAMDEDKDRTVRSRRGSGVAASRPRRVRSMAAVKDEDE